ncbi:MAG: hypothetical protein ACR2QF_09755 [Geminicoccaceae bacterium]
MSVVISGRDDFVRFSTGAGEELFSALALLADRLADGADDLSVVAWLKGYVAGQDVALSPRPEAFSTDRQLSFFLKTVHALAQELTREHPDSTLCAVNWDRQLRLSWLARLVQLDEIVRNDLQANISLQPLNLAGALAPEDYAECELIRLENRWKTLDDHPEEQRALADEMVQVAEEGNLAMVSPARVSMLYERQGELLIASGQVQRGAGALRHAASLQPDEESKVLLNEMASEALANT